jgi:hypothetical protein
MSDRVRTLFAVSSTVRALLIDAAPPGVHLALSQLTRPLVYASENVVRGAAAKLVEEAGMLGPDWLLVSGVREAFRTSRDVARLVKWARTKTPTSYARTWGYDESGKYTLTWQEPAKPEEISDTRRGIHLEGHEVHVERQHEFDNLTAAANFAAGLS